MSSKIIRADNQQPGRVSRFDFGVLGTASASVAVLQPPQRVEAEPAVVAPISSEQPGSQQPTAAELGHAQDEIELMLRQARMKAAEIEKEAYEKGFSEGERAGRETAEQVAHSLGRRVASP